MRAFSQNLVGLMLLGTVVFGGSLRAVEAGSIEVFIVNGQLLTNADRAPPSTATVATYQLDDLGRFESSLSEELPTDVAAAKIEALHKIQKLTEAHIMPLRNTALGLAKAVQYGIDRYPAIVFDGEAVVYGVTDLSEAADHYEAWRRERAR